VAICLPLDESVLALLCPEIREGRGQQINRLHLGLGKLDVTEIAAFSPANPPLKTNTLVFRGSA
jgi:hypothetical protein